MSQLLLLSRRPFELLELYQEIHGAAASRKYGAVAKHATMMGDRLHGPWQWKTSSYTLSSSNDSDTRTRKKDS